jgi:hypothetical protein
LNSKNKESSVGISLVISLVIYFIIILIFSVITFEENEDANFITVSLEFNQYEKKIVANNKSEKIPNKIKRKIPQQNIVERSRNKSVKISETEIPVEIVDTSLTKIDSLKYFSELIDSFVHSYPKLFVLKSAIAQHVKHDKNIETDSAMAVRRMKKYMLDYYKNKFPTPLSKFGNATPGIPIDKILDLFRKDNKEEIKKIKKYFNLETH